MRYMETIQLKNLYSVSEAAKYLSLTAQGVHYLINAKKLKSVTLNSKYKYIDKVELDKYLTS